MNKFSLPPAIKPLSVKSITSGLTVGLLATFPLAIPSVAVETTTATAPGFNVQVSSKKSVNRAVTAYNKGNFRTSIAYSKNALIQGLRTPVKSVAYSNLCAALGAEHRYKEARKACDSALKLDAGNWQAYANRASVNWRDNDEVQARADLRAAKKIAGNIGMLVQATKIIG